MLTLRREGSTPGLSGAGIAAKEGESSRQVRPPATGSLEMDPAMTKLGCLKGRAAKHTTPAVAWLRVEVATTTFMRHMHNSSAAQLLQAQGQRQRCRVPARGSSRPDECFGAPCGQTYRRACSPPSPPAAAGLQSGEQPRGAQLACLLATAEGPPHRADNSQSGNGRRGVGRVARGL